MMPADVAQLRLIIAQLRRENARLKAASLEPYADGEISLYQAEVQSLRTRLPPDDIVGRSLLNTIYKTIEQNLKGRRRIAKQLAKLEAHLPSKEAERLRKIRTMAERGATQGERDAAANRLAVLQRLRERHNEG